jgi:hypothetical protein
VLAEVEARPTLSQLFATLAREADAQGRARAAKMSSDGAALPELTHHARESSRGSHVASVCFHPPGVGRHEVRGMSAYAGAHPGGHTMPATVESYTVRGRRRQSARGRVLANDGLISMRV